MDKFLIGYKRKCNNNKDTDAGDTQHNENINNKCQGGITPKLRKYEISYLSFGFTSVINDNIEKPLCLTCNKVLAADSMRPCKLKRHLQTMHSEYVGKPIDFFRRKLDEFNKQ